MFKGLISVCTNKQNLPMLPPDAQVPGNVCIIINSSCIFYVKIFHQAHKQNRDTACKRQVHTHLYRRLSWGVVSLSEGKSQGVHSVQLCAKYGQGRNILSPYH